MERLLQINVVTLAMLATCTVGLGQYDATLPFLVFVCAMLSFWLTDVSQKFRLNNTLANIASVAVLLLAIPGMLEFDRRAIITGVAKLLIYQQVVLMFKRKDPRTYLQLIRLSLLQVVVAAVLGQGTFFGPLLIVYLFTSLSSLVLLFLHSERLKYADLAPPRAAPQAEPGRWPLAHQTPALLSGSVGKANVEREFFSRLVRMGFVSLGISILVFFLTPRLGGGAWRGPGGLMQATVGYADHVALGDLGNVIQNPEEVLKISFSKEPDGASTEIRNELYLCGNLLAYYHGGEWSQFPGINPLPPCDPSPRMLYQRILMEPADNNDLFCVWPYALLPDETKTENQGAKTPRDRRDDKARVIFDPGRGKLMRENTSAAQRISFTLGAPAFDEGAQDEIVPNPSKRLLPSQSNVLLQIPVQSEGSHGDGRGRNRPRAFGPPIGMPGPPPFNGFAAPPRPTKPTVPELIHLAKQWVDDNPKKTQSVVAKAKFLASQLRDTGQFRYSLEGQNRDLAIDPIEDFVTKHPAGHCEYFASALVLMLRSQGIPTALAVGFKTAEWNPYGGYYQVRQLHAHTWVEVFLTPDQIPQEVKGKKPGANWGAGAWMRLDPTPAGDHDVSGFWSTGLGKHVDWFEFAWNKYVLDMDRSRQRKSVYDPFSAFVHMTTINFLNAEWWRDKFGGIAEYFGLIQGGPEGVSWFHWRVFALIFGVGAVVVMLSGVYRFYLKSWLEERAAEAAGESYHGRSKVVFYRRLEAILERCGLACPPSLTQREFARIAAHAISRWENGDKLARIPVRLAEVFYSVRFGSMALDKPRAEAVEQALRTLEQAVAAERAKTESDGRKDP
jgi:hypothetical protein